MIGRKSEISEQRRMDSRSVGKCFERREQRTHGGLGRERTHGKEFRDQTWASLARAYSACAVVVSCASSDPSPDAAEVGPTNTHGK